MDSGQPLTEALVVGVDGCRAGWIYVEARPVDKGLAIDRIGIAETFRNLIEAASDSAFVSVDIPIGLSADGRREADYAARRFIGPRRSSVFPPPPRPVLAACPADYWTLNALSKSIRAGISRQTFNITPKIGEADRVMTPALQARVRECHPEVSFCALNGDCLRHAKRTREGQCERLDLLETVFGPAIRALLPPRGAALDDLYDAAVLAWTAARIARGEARSLPATPEMDARGLRMEIVY